MEPIFDPTLEEETDVEPASTLNERLEAWRADLAERNAQLDYDTQPY